VGRSEEVGYLRGLVVAYEGLGDANAAADQFEAAETALVNSVQVAEQMGMARDRLNTMTKIAKARSGMGRDVEATELLASVCANPISEQQAWTETQPIRVIAGEALADLRSRLGPDEYEAAYERGWATSFDATVDELLGRTDEPASTTSTA
jgi:hypothetical protein